jgi:hypothetical protein
MTLQEIGFALIKLHGVEHSHERSIEVRRVLTSAQDLVTEQDQQLIDAPKRRARNAKQGEARS